MTSIHAASDAADDGVFRIRQHDILAPFRDVVQALTAIVQDINAESAARHAEQQRLLEDRIMTRTDRRPKECTEETIDLSGTPARSLPAQMQFSSSADGSDASRDATASSISSQTSLPDSLDLPSHLSSQEVLMQSLSQMQAQSQSQTQRRNTSDAGLHDEDSILDLHVHATANRKRKRDAYRASSKSLLEAYPWGEISKPDKARRLNQILAVLCSIHDAFQKRISKTRRGIYYEAVELFEKDQKVVDLIISQLEAYWNCQSPAFRVVAGYRGLYAGPIRVKLSFARAASQSLSPDHSQATERSTRRRAGRAQPRQDSTQPGAEAPMYTAIPIESIDRIADIQYDEPPRWVLVVEKETTFRERMEELNQQAIVDPTNGTKGFGVLITGKGYPDHATRCFLEKLAEKLPDSVPFYALFDGDVHGVDILHAYLGRMEHYRKEQRLGERLIWLGMKPSKWRLLKRQAAQSQLLAPSPAALADITNTTRSFARRMPKSVTRLDGTSALTIDFMPPKADIAVVLDNKERGRALTLVRQLRSTSALELARLVLVGYKYELDSLGNVPLHELLP